MWRYLSRTKDLEIVLGGEDNIEELRLWLHCNASWVDDSKNRKTTTRHVIFLGNSPIKWQSKQQDLVTLSTTKVEFVNFSIARRDLV